VPRPISPKCLLRGSANPTLLILIPLFWVLPCMSNEQIGSIVVLLLILIATAHLFGYLFARLRQPKVIGEIVAGVILGPTLLGRIAPSFSASIFSDGAGAHVHDVVLGFLYWMGLLLLMFISGSETRRLFGRDDRRQVAWLASMGTVLPFVLALLVVPLFPIHRLMGVANQRNSLILVIGIAVAVTSIPVISRIFYDLKILHTRFARLVLGVAVLEDIVLWAVLAMATALAKSSVLPKNEILRHLAVTFIFFVVGLALAPRLLRRLHQARWNILAAASPIGYLIAILFAFAAVAAMLDVSLVFAAFLAGYGVASNRELFADAWQLPRMPAADQESSWPAWPTTPALLTRRPTLHWFCLPSSHRRLPVHGWSTYCARGGRYSRLIPRPRPNVNQRLTSGPQPKPSLEKS